jgi:hypothetical protein|tara:strand:- start:424 stop:684 length:261 start_codon:yes stop_codon:yes gene_type:complete
MSFEFRAGRKRVVKSVETVEEANALMRKMVAIRNENSLWENIDVKTGHLRAVDELEKVMGAIFDVFETMSIYVDGKSVRRIWGRGF